MRMRKIMALVISAMLLMALSLPVSSGSVQEVTAYENKDASVKFNGLTIIFEQGGKTLPLLMYEGVSYIPIMPLSKHLGIPSVWDPATATMYLGTSPLKDGVSLINDMQPYASSHGNWFGVVTSEPGKLYNFGGVDYDSYIDIYAENYGYYNLEGKYSTLTFKAYNTSSSERSLLLYGDNDALLNVIKLKGMALPTVVSMDVKNVFQLKIEGSGGSHIIILDAILN